MALESATHIADLNSSYPVGATDLIAQGDDHIRLIKATLQATFPSANRAFYLPRGVAAQTSTVTVAATDQGKLYPVSASAAARTVNLPANADIPDGFQVTIFKSDYSPNTVTIDGNSSDTINGELTLVLTKGYQSALLQWNAAASGWFAKVDTVVPTGAKVYYGSDTAPAGWLFANGVGTIGSASSGADYANARAEALFHHCYDTYSNTVCPVSGGRGASAAADWAANKRLTLPDLRGRAIFGNPAMGGVTEATGVLSDAVTGVDISTRGIAFGQEDLALSAANIPELTTSSDGEKITQFYVPTSKDSSAGTDNFVVTNVWRGNPGTLTDFTTANDHTHTVGTAAGSLENVATLPPGFIDNVIIAL
jgi:hypothetical protein